MSESRRAHNQDTYNPFYHHGSLIMFAHATETAAAHVHRFIQTCCSRSASRALLIARVRKYIPSLIEQLRLLDNGVSTSYSMTTYALSTIRGRNTTTRPVSISDRHKVLSHTGHAPTFSPTILSPTMSGTAGLPSRLSLAHKTILPGYTEFPQLKRLGTFSPHHAG